MEKRYNRLTEEQLICAQKQREENYLTEYGSVNVRMRRELSEDIKRFFGRYGMTPAEAMARFAETALREGKVIFDENGFREGGNYDT